MDWTELEHSKIKARQELLEIDPELAQAKIRKLIQPQFWSETEPGEWNELPLSETIEATMSQRSPGELVEVFALLQQQNLDVVLVGGQAVNFWAERPMRSRPRIGTVSTLHLRRYRSTRR